LDGGKTDHPGILELLERYSRLAQVGKSIVLAWIPSHVGIRGNEKVDALAKDALNLNITNMKIPYTDFKVNINTFIRNKWQTIWDTFPNNKLHAIQPTVGRTHHTCIQKRREDVVLTRCRIGHTYLTHSYLLKGEQVPECIPCDCSISVHHILIDCIDYEPIRQRFFESPNLETLFERVPSQDIVGFLKEINLFYQI